MDHDLANTRYRDDDDGRGDDVTVSLYHTNINEPFKATKYILIYLVCKSGVWNRSAIILHTVTHCRSQWPRGLRRRSAAARLLRSWVRIPPGAWLFVCCECYMLSGRGLCDELITRPEESYRLWCIVLCDQETSKTRRPWPALGRSATENKQSKTVTH